LINIARVTGNAENRWNRVSEDKILVMRIRLLCVLILAVGSFLLGDESYGQTFEADYFKRNSALTDFAKLGVSEEGYARCATSINLRDPENTVKLITLDEEEFRDDGAGYDLRANDGILTSVKLFPYDKGESLIPAGQYRKLADDFLLHDELFEHLSAARFPLPKIYVSCNIRVTHCGSLPEPQRSECYQAGPPYTHFHFYGCHLALTW